MLQNSSHQKKVNLQIEYELFMQCTTTVQMKYQIGDRIFLIQVVSWTDRFTVMVQRSCLTATAGNVLQQFVYVVVSKSIPPCLVLLNLPVN